MIVKPGDVRGLGLETLFGIMWDLSLLSELKEDTKVVQFVELEGRMCKTDDILTIIGTENPSSSSV